MRARFQFARGRSTVSQPARPVLIRLFIGVWFLFPVAVHADNAPSNAIGRIEGTDVSVEGGAGGTATSATGAVANGNVVTVHSGKARMTLFSGGTVEICGPAKFTLLLSGQAVTLALNFGRVRAELPATTTLRIFTPTIVGTPIDISGQWRDITVGLSLDDSLCVVTTSGALQLEHQFTGEKIIIPQAGDFSLSPGQLLPTAGTPGTCRCLEEEPGASSVAADSAALAPSATVPPRALAAASADNAASQPETEPLLAYSVLEHANQAHPLVASEGIRAPAVPPSYVTSDAAVPVLVFTAASPLPPPGPSAETLLLIREARLSPEWEFSGRVEPPAFATAMEHALGEKPITTSSAPGAQQAEPSPPQKKKGGFWAALKRAFRGGM